MWPFRKPVVVCEACREICRERERLERVHDQEREVAKYPAFGSLNCAACGADRSQCSVRIYEMWDRRRAFMCITCDRCGGAWNERPLWNDGTPPPAPPAD